MLKQFKLKMLIGSVLAILLVACSGENNKDVAVEENDNFNKEGFPIVDESIELSFFTGKQPTTADDYNEVTVWKNYNEMTNVDIDWELVLNDGLEEKKNLALSGDNKPDVFYTASMSNEELVKNGDQGTFIDLDELIDEYMPNLKAILDENPDIRKGITFPDGNVYGLPTIYDPDFSSLIIGAKPWINKTWLDELGMDIPETTDEFYDYLKGVRDTNLTGTDDEEIPFGGVGISGLRNMLSGAFGINNNGIAELYVDIEESSDDLRFIPTTDGYKEMLEYMHMLYSEGLIHESIFSIETNDSYALGSKGLYGSVMLTSPDTIYGSEAGENYVGMPPLEGPHGDRDYVAVGSSLRGMAGFSITNENEHVPETLRWMDYFYSDEGTEMYFMGEEGVTYEETDDGDVEYVDDILHSDDGLSMEQNLKPHITWLGGGYPGIVKEDYFKGAESKKEGIEAAEKLEPYLVEDRFPSFTYTPEENKRMSILSSDIEKYADEMLDKFVVGEKSFDEWDDYVDTITKMGLEEYMEIKQSAYERFIDN